MNAITLFLSDGTPVDPHLCGKCRRIWESRDSAERCCTCSFCGMYCDWGEGVTHDDCRTRRSIEVDSRKLAEATLVAEYRGPFVVKGRFYHDVEELFGRFSEDELPEFGFCCDEVPAHIDISDVIESVSCQMRGDWEEQPCEELEDGIAAWNKANEDNSAYFECGDRKWSKAGLLEQLANGRLS